MMKRLLGPLVVALAAVTVQANDVAIDVTATPSADVAGYMPGEIVRVEVRLRDATTDVNSLELSQVDLRFVNSALLPEFDPNDAVNPITDAVIFGGGAAGEGQQPPGGNPQDWDAVAGPALPGCPAACLIGTVPSASGGGTIYFWLRTNTANTALLNPPAAAPGRLFIQFKVTLGSPGQATIDALGPALDDGSSSGAFFQQAGTATIWSNGDADTADNVTGGILNLTIVPEPASLGLLVLGSLAALRRRRI
jgi:hypothetical protein